jgi:predicted SnoaL-like aldol condensation-catalyzing enzyme
MSAHTRRLAMLAAAASASTLLLGTPADAAPAHFGDPTAANKALVSYVYDQLLLYNNVAAIDKYIAPDYKQHNPQLTDGPAGLRAYITWRAAQHPQPRNYQKRVIAEGDLVTVMNDYQEQPSVSYMNIADTFRVRDGKLVEHWDTIEQVLPTTASGHNVYSTLSWPQVNTADPFAPTRRNQQLVENYLNGLYKRHDASVIDRYVARDLYQHDQTLRDGSAAVKAAYLADRAAHPHSIVSSVQVVAEGDLVAVHYHYQADAADRGQAVEEVFRVRDGKIVEHWDAHQDVPATSANPNTMF